MVPTNSAVTVDVQLFDSQWELSQICAKTRTTNVDIIQTFDRPVLWGAVRKNIISDRFSTTTAIPVQRQLNARRDS